MMCFFAPGKLRLLSEILPKPEYSIEQGDCNFYVLSSTTGPKTHLNFVKKMWSFINKFSGICHSFFIANKQITERLIMYFISELISRVLEYRKLIASNYCTT